VLCGSVRYDSQTVYKVYCVCVYAMWGFMFGVVLSHMTRISVPFSEQ